VAGGWDSGGGHVGHGSDADKHTSSGSIMNLVNRCDFYITYMNSQYECMHVSFSGYSVCVYKLVSILVL
jgi:hypothetical protein